MAKPASVDPKAGFTHAKFCQPTQNLKISKKKPSKNRAKICKHFTSYLCEARFCLSLLGEFEKSADKVGVCKSGSERLLLTLKKRRENENQIPY